MKMESMNSDAFGWSRVRTLPDLGGGVAARGALVLLDVHGAATATTAQSVRLVVALTETGGTLGWKAVSILFLIFAG